MITNLLAEKTAVVTGAASGNGRGIARALAAHGADVVIADIRESPREGGDPTHELLTVEADARSMFVECDVSDREAFEPVMDAADEFGGVDIMVNNAGIFGRAGSVLETDLDDLHATFGVNVDGVYNGSQAAALRMLENDKGGSIINMSSVAGLHGDPANAIYTTSKGAIRLFTYALAGELGSDGIRVNAIHPGYIDTAMITDDVAIVGTEEGEELLETIPLGRFGQPVDIGNVAVFLGSDLAGYVTGESVVVDGGVVSQL